MRSHAAPQRFVYCARGPSRLADLREDQIRGNAVQSDQLANGVVETTPAALDPSRECIAQFAQLIGHSTSSLPPLRPQPLRASAPAA
jgi:hypothetical protein